jgi:hypothetical protein
MSPSGFHASSQYAADWVSVCSIPNAELRCWHQRLDVTAFNVSCAAARLLAPTESGMNSPGMAR